MKEIIESEEYFKAKERIEELKFEKDKNIASIFGYSFDDILENNYNSEDNKDNMVKQHIMRTALLGHRTCFLNEQLSEELVKELHKLNYKIGFIYPDTYFVSCDGVRIKTTSSVFSIMSYQEITDSEKSYKRNIKLPNASSLSAKIENVKYLNNKLLEDRRKLVASLYKNNYATIKGKAYSAISASLLSDANNQIIANSMDMATYRSLRRAGYRVKKSKSNNCYIITPIRRIV